VSDGAAASSEIASADGTVGALVSQLSRSLRLAAVSDPRREAVEIVAALLDVPRFWPAANGDSEVKGDLVDAAVRAAAKRALGAPLAYAVGRASFRHLTLEVDESVLIPRVETELLVERVLDRCDAGTRTIADIGTGSGAIALSLAFEREFECVVGTDISRGALAIAERNGATLKEVLRSRVEFLHGSFLAPLAGRELDAVISNPPYIAYAEGPALPAPVRDWEPAVALLCADTGLAATRSIVGQASRCLRRGGILALEVDVRRAGLVAEMIAVHGSYTGVEVLLDLSGRERFVFARRI
jgi:release factor glutamine methyltransferase